MGSFQQCSYWAAGDGTATAIGSNQRLPKFLLSSALYHFTQDPSAAVILSLRIERLIYLYFDLRYLFAKWPKALQISGMA